MSRVTEIEAHDTGPAKVGIAVADFNRAITDGLLSGALAALDELGIANVVVARVPGALELALVAGRLAGAGCGAVVALGAVIKGDTDHYEIVAETSARALADVQISTGVPVGNGVLTVREIQHAIDRSRPGAANKGADAARAAVLTARLLAAV